MPDYYTVETDFSYTVDDTIDGDASPTQFLDAVAEHLQELKVDDLMIFADEDVQTFTVSLLVEVAAGGQVEDAVGTCMGLLRTAFHAGNGTTRGWPTPQEAFLTARVTPAVVDELTPA